MTTTGLKMKDLTPSKSVVLPTSLPVAQVHGQLAGLGRLDEVRLEHRHLLLTGDDALDRREFGVLTGDRREIGCRDAGTLERGDDAAGLTVVGGVDTPSTWSEG